jgi:hypothetical protein
LIFTSSTIFGGIASARDDWESNVSVIAVFGLSAALALTAMPPEPPPDAAGAGRHTDLRAESPLAGQRPPLLGADRGAADVR